MSAITDRTRQDSAPALLAWHAEESSTLLKDALDAFFAACDPLIAAHGNDAIGQLFAPFLDKMQAAGDQFDCLYCLATGKAHPVPKESKE